MSKQVYSTLSADTRYVDWQRTPGLNVPGRSVLVRGGSGVALLGAGQHVLTRHGARTEVSDEEAEFLKNDPHFKEHEKRGFVRIENAARDPETVARKMEDDKGSAPKTPDDVKKSAEEAAAGGKAGLSADEVLQVTTNKKK